MKAEELETPKIYGYVGWELPEHERTKLLAQFPPSYTDVVAHHVTLKAGVSAEYPLPHEAHGDVVGWADDGISVQCVVVSIGGSTTRADNGTYHITWSLDKASGAKAWMSNKLLKDGFTKLDKAIPIQLVPKFFEQTQVQETKLKSS
jgi:hypothetical protein